MAHVSAYTTIQFTKPATHLDHRLLVRNAPPGLLRVVVDRDDGVELRRVYRRAFARELFVLHLRLRHELVCPQLGVELGDHAQSLLMRRGVLSCALGRLLRRTKGVLQLLLFLSLRQPPSCRRSACHTEKALRRVRSWATLDLDLEVPEGHVVTFLLGLDDSFLLLLLFLGLPVRLALGLLLGIALLIKTIKTFASKPGAGHLRFAGFDLLQEP